MSRPLTALVAGALTPAGVALSRTLVARGAVVYAADDDLAGAVHLANALGPTAFALALRADDEVQWAGARAAVLAEQGRLDVVARCGSVNGRAGTCTVGLRSRSNRGR